MEHSPKHTEENIKAGGAAAVAKREAEDMSHHEACKASAFMAVQGMGEKQHTSRCSYNTLWAPSKRHNNNLRTLLSLIVTLATWVSLIGLATAHDAHGDRQRSAPLPAAPLENDSQAWKGPSLLVVDTRPSPVVPPLMHLLRRNGSPTSTKSASPSKTTIETDSSASPSASGLTVPSPFDSALSNNFTAPCTTFLRRMLSDSNFNDCHPFSLLLQTSSDFFDAEKSFVRITGTLEATCAVNPNTCQGVMDSYAVQLRQDANCAVDYANDNPQVLQAYNGLVAYEPLYQASCLRDQEGSYCFANAVTNTTGTADAYPYYLPLGVALPGGSTPTCNSCLQNVMAIFAATGANATQPVSKTYNSAAQQIDVNCGPHFVNQTATPLKGAAASTTVSLTPFISLFIMLFIFFFQ